MVREDGPIGPERLDAVTSGQVQIIPERYAKGYLDWISEKRDWPLVDNFGWGHQIPIWTKQFESTSDRQQAADRMLATVDDPEWQVDGVVGRTRSVCTFVAR